MLDYLIIADDLSGACDTAVQFRKFGFRTLVLSEGDDSSDLIDGFDAVAITTNSRDLSRDEARFAVRNMAPFIKRLGYRHLYKKIDSTWRGNIGSEMEVLIEELDLSFAVICSAYPENRRLGLGGYLLVDGTLLHHTSMAKDPASPIRQGYLPDLLASQTRHRVDYIPLSMVEAGPAEIQRFIMGRIKDGPCLFVSDATEPVHLESLAGISREGLPSFIFAGSAGLSAAMLEKEKKGTNRKSLPVLTVVGSVNPKNAHQVEKLLEDGGAKELLVSWQVLMGGESNRVNALLSEAIELLGGGRDVVIRTSRDAKNVELSITEGKKAGLSRAEIADRIAIGLQRFVMDVLGSVKIGGLAVTGGATALKLLSETGCRGIEVFREIEPGVPLGQVVGGDLDGLKIITKAGGFGSPDVFRLGLDVLKKEE